MLNDVDELSRNGSEFAARLICSQFPEVDDVQMAVVKKANTAGGEKMV